MATETPNGPQVVEPVIYLSAGGQVVSREDVGSSVHSRNGHGEPSECRGPRLAGYQGSGDHSYQLLNKECRPGTALGT